MAGYLLGNLNIDKADTKLNLSHEPTDQIFASRMVIFVQATVAFQLKELGMRQQWGGIVVLAALAAAVMPFAQAEPTAPALPASSTSSAPSVAEVAITAPEPRYVAPTLRDRIGRIWAPVYLNGKGPYRLVLDTGASNSAVIAKVAQDLGLPPTGALLLHGVTGSATVPFVTVDTFVVGDMEQHSTMLPIVPDALGGADGVLGMEVLKNKRIFIDFLHDKITIIHSHMQRAPTGYVTIPLTRTANGLLMARAYVGGVRVQAIIDTGGQATVANSALQVALRSRHPSKEDRRDFITGATDDVQPGHDVSITSVSLGQVIIQSPYITVSDLHIFERWHMTEQPTVIIGIDTLGLLAGMVIDYSRMELQMLTRHNYDLYQDLRFQ
jgi:predicted aspartyl protease